MDEKDVRDLLDKARNEIPARVYQYILVGVGIVVLFLCLTGGYFLYSVIQDAKVNEAFYKEKIEAYDKQLAENNKKLDDLERKRQELQDDVEKYRKDYNDISYNYAQIIKNINKPLPQPQQDEVFTKLGYLESWYQPDGGRRFSVGNTTKLQVELTERSQFLEQRNNLLLTNDTLNKVILTDLNSIEMYKDNEKKWTGKEVEYQKSVKDLQKELRKERYKKWLYSILIGSAAAYAGHSVK